MWSITWLVKRILGLLELLSRTVNTTQVSEPASAAEFPFNYTPNAFRLGFTNDLTQRITLTLPCEVRCRCTWAALSSHQSLMKYSYSADINKARVFKQYAFNESLRVFIGHPIQLQLYDLKAALWEIYLLSATVKCLNAKIREELLFHLSCTALQNLMKRSCDFSVWDTKIK